MSQQCQHYQHDDRHALISAQENTIIVVEKQKCMKLRNIILTY